MKLTKEIIEVVKEKVAGKPIEKYSWHDWSGIKNG